MVTALQKASILFDNNKLKEEDG